MDFLSIILTLFFIDIRHALPFLDVADHFGKKGGDREDFEAPEGCGDRDTVRDDDFGESCAL